MNKVEVSSAMVAGKGATHRDGNMYLLLEACQVKIAGVWVAAVTYRDVSGGGLYCRALGDFKDFSRT